MTEKNEKLVAELASDLNRELDVLRQSPRQATVEEVERIVDFADSLNAQMKRLAVRFSRCYLGNLSVFDYETVLILEDFGYLEKSNSNYAAGIANFNI